MQNSKVVGIGLSKTGTSSLSEALTILGYTSGHYIHVEDFHKYDAISDSPVPILYKVIDSRHPESKFILTTREEQKWLKSFENHVKRWQLDMKMELGTARSDALLTNYVLYGTVKFDPGKMLAGFREYHQDVLDHFSNRPQDLLVMDITKGDGWEKLCPFLGIEIPDVDFPCGNTHKQVEVHLKRKKQFHRKLINYFMYKFQRAKLRIRLTRKYGRKV